MCKIFLGGLPVNITPEAIIESLAYLKLEDPKITLPKRYVKSKKKKVPVGFAILQLNCDEQAEKLIDLKELKIFGKKISVKPYLEGEELKKTVDYNSKCKVFLPQIPAEISIDDLKKKLSEYGEIKDLYKLKDPVTQEYRNSGYCFFCKAESAEKVIEAEQILINNHWIKLMKFTKKKKEKDELKKLASQGGRSGGSSDMTDFKYLFTPRDSIQKKNLNITEINYDENSRQKVTLMDYDSNRNSYGRRDNSFGRLGNSFGKTGKSFGRIRNSYGRIDNSCGRTDNSWGRIKNSSTSISRSIQTQTRPLEPSQPIDYVAKALENIKSSQRREIYREEVFTIEPEPVDRFKLEIDDEDLQHHIIPTKKDYYCYLRRFINKKVEKNTEYFFREIKKIDTSEEESLGKNIENQ